FIVLPLLAVSDCVKLADQFLPKRRKSRGFPKPGNYQENPGYGSHTRNNLQEVVVVLIGFIDGFYLSLNPSEGTLLESFQLRLNLFKEIFREIFLESFQLRLNLSKATFNRRILGSKWLQGCYSRCENNRDE